MWNIFKNRNIFSEKSCLPHSNFGLHAIYKFRNYENPSFFHEYEKCEIP